MVLICKNVKHFTLGNFKHFQIMKISIELLKLKILQFALGKNIKNQPHLKRWQRRIALIRNCKPSLWRTFFYIQLSMSSTRFFSEIFHNKTSKNFNLKMNHLCPHHSSQQVGKKEFPSQLSRVVIGLKTICKTKYLYTMIL